MTVGKYENSLPIATPLQPFSGLPAIRKIIFSHAHSDCDEEITVWCVRCGTVETGVRSLYTHGLLFSLRTSYPTGTERNFLPKGKTVRLC